MQTRLFLITNLSLGVSHMKNLTKKILFLSASLATCLTLGCHEKKEAQEKNVDLPVSRVVMYQSGIGYIERNATVSGNELVLRIRPDQINDILKSLTVIDRANGRPVSISLPVDHTTITKLSQIPGQVREGGIHALLEAFRGANVRIKTKNQTLDGRIVGVETQLKQVLIDETVPDESTVTLLTKGDVLNVIPIQTIKSVSLFDASLANGLEKSLDISLNEGDWKQIELRIQMDSAKKREIALSYLVAMPTWKPAYRLVLGDDDKGTLQGWAIVSNVTGSDWKNIAFSLVSGRPMSFTYDLYRPQFLSRPDLTSLSEQRAEAPIITKSAFAEAKKSSSIAAGGALNSQKKVMASPALAMKQKSRAFDSNEFATADVLYDGAENIESAFEEDNGSLDAPTVAPISSDEIIQNFAQQASNTQLGSFDEYKIDAKLSIPDGNTALVNLIQNNVTARDTRMFKPIDNISEFNEFYKGWRLNDSYQTIELKNELNVALDSGPITIYRNSAVIGEGYLSRTEKGATAYITFAKEGRIDVQITDSVESFTPKLTTVQNGKCSYENEEKLTQTFTFSSNIPSPTTALLQIPKFERWIPQNFPENVTVNENAYVIAAQIPENASTAIPLTMTQTRQFAARSLLPGRGDNCSAAIQNALDENLFDETQKTRFSQYLDDTKNIEINQTKMNNLSTRKREIEHDQATLSQTLSGLQKINSSNAAKLKNQIITRQRANEQKLVEITGDIYDIQVQNGDIQLRMQEYLKDLNYTRTQK